MSAQCQMQITQADSAALILPYPSCFPIHSFHLTDYTVAQSSPHECAVTVTVIVVCHISAASAPYYITASSFSMNTSMRQRLLIRALRSHSLLNSRVAAGFNRSEPMCAAEHVAPLTALLNSISACLKKSALWHFCVSCTFTCGLVCWVRVESWQCRRQWWTGARGHRCVQIQPW